MSDEIMSDEIVSDETMSDEIVSDETMSDETMSDEIVSDETMSDETMSDEQTSDAMPDAAEETPAEETPEPEETEAPAEEVPEPEAEVPVAEETETPEPEPEAPAEETETPEPEPEAPAEETETPEAEAPAEEVPEPEKELKPEDALPTGTFNAVEGELTLSEENDAPVEESTEEEKPAEETPTEEIPTPTETLADELPTGDIQDKADIQDQTEEAIESEDLIYELPEEDQVTSSNVQSPYDRPGKWYVVSITSGQEKLAKSNLETRIQTMNVAGKIFEVTIPLEEQVEFKGTKKEVVQKKIFPGYILVRCQLDDETWHVIRNTPSITAFIGAGTKPIPLRRTEVEAFLGDKGDGQQVQRKIRPLLRYEVGETVRVKEGPFTDFQGEVTEINEDQLKVKLLLNIFGRETPVELEFSQVSKQ